MCQGHLCNLGIVLQLFELALIVCNEVFEHGVVAVHAVLSLGQLHASLQLLDIQEDVLQRHCEHTHTYKLMYRNTHANHTDSCAKQGRVSSTVAEHSAMQNSPAAAFST